MSRPDYDSDPVEIPGYRRSRVASAGNGSGRVVLISALTSAIVSVITVYVMLPSNVATAPIAGEKAPAVGTTVEVPKVVGMQIDSASELLTNRKLQLVIKERRVDASSAVDTILEQTPLAESRVAAGQPIAVVVSSEGAPVQVPSVAGQSLDAAREALQTSGFAIGEITEVEGAKASEVVATVPAAGESAKAGQAIALSVGKAGPAVELPALVGAPLAKVRKDLSALGLSVGKVQERYDSKYRAYIVLSQDPAEGSQVAPGSTVDLIVNEGD